MLLKAVLDANDINRNTYNSLERRTGLPFMKRGLVDGKRGDRYTFTHVVALAVMLRFQQVGVKAEHAAVAVDAMYDMLIDWVATRTFKPEDMPVDGCWITISLFANDEFGWSSGLKNSSTFSAAEPVVKLSTNVAIIMEELWPRVLTPSSPQTTKMTKAEVA